MSNSTFATFAVDLASDLRTSPASGQSMASTPAWCAAIHHNSIAKPKAANTPAKAGVAYGATKQAAPPRGIPR